MARERSDGRYPDVAALVARLASLHGLSGVLDVGLTWTTELGLLHPHLEIIGVRLQSGGPPAGSIGFPFRRILSLADPGAWSSSNVDFSRMAVLVASADGTPVVDGALEALGAGVDHSPLLVLAGDVGRSALASLIDRGMAPTFVGRTRATPHDDERTADVVIIDRIVGDDRTRAPEDFRVAAVMTAYNEEDLIGPVLEKLIGDGVGVYLIDNWSTDRTFEIAREFTGRGLIGLERFPTDPTHSFQLEPLLRRVEAVAADLDARWCIHHDADERRAGPWPGVGLRDALWRVERSGFTAVDHTVLNYRPVDDAFEPSSDFERHFRYFEFGLTPDLLLQVKAWRNEGRVDLASSGGHDARFPGRRVFPYKFTLKHYPIRSQVHGERKVHHDRIARWDPGERARGWHVHYDHVAQHPSFTRAREDLIEDRGAETFARYLPEMLGGVGLAPEVVPSWALGSRGGRAVFFRLRRFTSGSLYERLRRFPVLRAGVVRRPLARLKARLLEGRASSSRS